ncbi:MAG TPA: hypothetical protein VLH84_05180 [Patescibacteria group bacterium]|nr:hypothetical protein [Patescibacteria group bacterium]
MNEATKRAGYNYAPWQRTAALVAAVSMLLLQAACSKKQKHTLPACTAVITPFTGDNNANPIRLDKDAKTGRLTLDRSVPQAVTAKLIASTLRVRETGIPSGDQTITEQGTGEIVTVLDTHGRPHRVIVTALHVVPNKIEDITLYSPTGSTGVSSGCADAKNDVAVLEASDLAAIDRGSSLTFSTKPPVRTGTKFLSIGYDALALGVEPEEPYIGFVLGIGKQNGPQQLQTLTGIETAPDGGSLDYRRTHRVERGNSGGADVSTSGQIVGLIDSVITQTPSNAQLRQAGVVVSDAVANDPSYVPIIGYDIPAFVVQQDAAGFVG